MQSESAVGFERDGNGEEVHLKGRDREMTEKSLLFILNWELVGGKP